METTSIEFKSKCIEPVNLFGYMKGSVTINGDILEPIMKNGSLILNLVRCAHSLGEWEDGSLGEWDGALRTNKRLRR
jgi:hypothetical protein